jgi:5'-3' exonuclease
MGIPYYFYVLMKNYPRILHSTTPKRCTDFFMDFNGAIHHAANMAFEADQDGMSCCDFDAQVMEVTWKYLQECVSVADPSDMVHVCTDGVAPVAKMYQQRKRRYLSVWKNQQLRHTPKWDRNCISPGTPFMCKLAAFMNQRIRDRDMKKQVSYFFSSADEEGEGEHKIFARIATLPSTSHIIVHGLDADLIMLSLISHKPHIFLMREPTGNYKDMQTSDGFMYVEIDKLRVALLQDLRIHYSWPVTQGMMDDIYCDAACKIIESYVTLCSLLGNDFLPHPITLPLKKNGYEKLLLAASSHWGIHQDLILPNATVNMPFLVDILKSLADDEDASMMKSNEDYLKRRPFECKEDPLDPYPLLHKDPLCKAIYDNHPNKWRALYYKHLFFTRLHDTTVITSACKVFVQGLTWVYRYYKRLPKDPRWYYPYSYSPTLRDLANFTSGLSGEEASRLYNTFTTPANRGFVSPNLQLLCIMPLGSKDILSKKVQDIMSAPDSGVSHMFPTSFGIQTYAKGHLWECIPILPALDIPLLEACLT